MGRSLWKGKSNIKEFWPLLGGAVLVQQQIKKHPMLQTFVKQSDPVYIKRRNHCLLHSQQRLLSLLPLIYFYNGYDFFKWSLVNNQLFDTKLLSINVVSQILTRESSVIHKAKVLKTKGKGKMVKKLKKTNRKDTPIRYKATLSKKYNK